MRPKTFTLKRQHSLSADVTLRNTRGHTALDQARMLAGADLSEETRKLLGGE